MFLVGLDGINSEQMISFNTQDKDLTQPKTLLSIGINNFYRTGNREHVICVGFMSQCNLRPTNRNIVDSGGTIYFFPNFESSFWSPDYKGLFEIGSKEEIM